jgi:hypothetical protein
MTGIKRLFTEYAPNVQASTAAYAMLGVVLDCRAANSIALTVTNADQTIVYKVQGANRSNFADAVEVQAPADLVASAIGNYASAAPVYAYYRVMIIDKVAATHGNATMTAIVKG